MCVEDQFVHLEAVFLCQVFSRCDDNTKPYGLVIRKPCPYFWLDQAISGLSCPSEVFSRLAIWSVLLVVRFTCILLTIFYRKTVIEITFIEVLHKSHDRDIILNVVDTIVKQDEENVICSCLHYVEMLKLTFIQVCSYILRPTCQNTTFTVWLVLWSEKSLAS